MGRALLRGLCLIGALVTLQAQAQQQLVVDGVPVPGLDTGLVPGTAYAPAEGYAQALGATYREDAGGVLLEFGGRYLSLRSFGSPEQAAEVEGAVTLDGEVMPGPGAVVRENVAYLPVKRVTEVLGGKAAYLGPQQTVAVVFPRPRLLGVEPPSIWGSSERFVLTFSAPVTLETFFETSLRVLRLRFERAELGDVPLASSRVSPGSRFSDAVFIPETGYLDFNLTLREGNTYSVFSEPLGEGVRVVLDLIGDDGARRTERPSLLVQAGPGTGRLAQRLAEALGERGVVVGLTGDAANPEEARDGVDTSLLVALGRASLEADRFNLYYLSDSAAVPLLHAPLRRAGALATLSSVEQARLAGLTPDLAWGERAAGLLAESLEASTPLRRELVQAAPLLALSGAAGRGLFLELNQADLDDPGLVSPLAASLEALARRP